MRRNRAFDVVTAFEQALSEYTGAPYVVTTDSCTNALFLSLKFWMDYLDPSERRVTIPKNTYVGVVQAARNAGAKVEFSDEEWTGSYLIYPRVVDSAKRFERDMYEEMTDTCLSFQAGKILPIGRGGAILTDNKTLADWATRVRLDGRTAGADYQDNTYATPGFHMYMTPPDAARGLWLLTYTDDGPDDTWESYPDLSKATWT